MSYNGWKNYETWLVGMWLDGNYDGEGTYRAALEVVEEAASEGQFRVADALKCFTEDHIEDAKELLGASLANDLLGAALAEVDWAELAEAKMSGMAES